MAQWVVRPSELQEGNSPPISVSFLTGTAALATETVGTGPPTLGTVMLYMSFPTCATAWSPFGAMSTIPAGGGGWPGSRSPAESAVCVVSGLGSGESRRRRPLQIGRAHL